MRFITVCKTFVVAGLLGAFWINTAQAAGFALLEQSAEGAGFAYAGASAGYRDGSALFFNPGALSLVKDPTVSVGVSWINPHAKFSNNGSSFIPTLGGASVSGDNGPNGSVPMPLPYIDITVPTSSGVNFGFGVHMPFGMITEYSDNWVGRYSAIKSDVKTVVMSPTVSYDFSDKFSFGASVNVTYMQANLTNAVDFGTIGLSQLGLPTAAALGLLPQHADGKAKVAGDDWGVGATAGFSYRFSENSRIGLAYRSQTKIQIGGDAEFDVPTNAMPLTSTGYFTDCGASADVTLPDSIAGGFYHSISDTVALLGDVQWTKWSHFDELRVSFGNGQPDSVVDESWKDVWRFSAGVEYKPLPSWAFRSGLTYDQSPIRNKFYRTPRIPDNDRYWIAIGATYQIAAATKIDLSYVHAFMSDAETEIATTGSTLVGDWDLSLDIVSLGATIAF